ncbi:MAG: prepilin-type N-terminal cleavage/methylation domain-containing protein [Pseudomonadota bacterium]
MTQPNRLRFFRANDARTNSSGRGFTLIEIALVLTIISLLVGGILRGQALIRNTKIRTLYNQYKELVAAVTAYQERYHFLPGDDLQASSRFAVPVGAGLPPITNGNGNGLIDDGDKLGAGGACTAGMTQNESCQALYHLRLAGIISGRDTVSPAHAFGGGLIISKGSAMIKDWNTPTSICYLGLTAEVARDMESSYDDSIAGAGVMRGGNNYMTGSSDALAGSVCILF